MLYYCIYVKFQKRLTMVRRWAEADDERFLNFSYLSCGGGYKLYTITKVHQPDPLWVTLLVYKLFASIPGGKLH